MDTVDLAQYAIRGTDADWEAATKRSKASQGGSGTVSIKTKVRRQRVLAHTGVRSSFPSMPSAKSPDTVIDSCRIIIFVWFLMRKALRWY